jgi:hypothetical protein
VNASFRGLDTVGVFVNRFTKTKLMDLAGGVLKHDIGEDSRIGLVWRVRAEADASVERPVDVQADGWAEPVHRCAFQADEEREEVAVLFDADALDRDADQAVGAGAAGAAAVPDAISLSMTRTPFSGSCARWITPRPCKAEMAGSGYAMSTYPAYGSLTARNPTIR